MSLGGQLKRLGKHSVIYGLGGLVSRILAVLLLPLYTRYLSPSDYGKVETLIALTTVIGIVLRFGIHSAFFRFYFDSDEPAARLKVVRTSFWFTMAMATVGMLVGNFIGTLAVYFALLLYRREQLGLEFDRGLLREMNRFGIPLVPTALFLWVTNFSDRLFLVHLADTTEVGLYSVGVRIASAMVLMLTAFRLAWPAFAYSIEDEREAKRTYAYVLTYVILATTWVATGLGLLSPWIVQWIAAPDFEESSRVVGPLAFAAVAFAGYIVVAIGVGRAKRTRFNWVVTGAAAVVNIGLNLLLIPPYGMMGAAVATIAAYVVMFVGMTWWSQQIYPVAYQWRRVVTAAAAGIALVAIGKLTDGGLTVSLALALVYPLALLPLGFYLPAERRAIGARLRPARP